MRAQQSTRFDSSCWRLVILAPSSPAHSPAHSTDELHCLRCRNIDTNLHRRLLFDAQRLRGQIYLRDNAIKPWNLSRDGRHIQKADRLSWHLLIVDMNSDRGASVVACLRYMKHREGVTFL